MHRMKIGNIALDDNLFMAPMAGITDPPFRAFVREFGCAMAFTEMVSAEGLARHIDKSLFYLQRLPDDAPFAVQLFGSKPESMAEAARIAVQKGAELVDINMGCPVKKVLKTGSGAALMRDPDKIDRILKSVRAAIRVPLTVKLRSGWKADINAPRIASIAEANGVDAVIIHPRTAEQAFKGTADWRVITEVKKAVRIPVIGNGDIRKAEDAAAMLKETGCDGVMVGRRAMGYPWIFREIKNYLETGTVPSPPGLSELRTAVLKHAEKSVSFYGTQAVRHLKIWLPWYIRGLNGASDFRKRIADFKNTEVLMSETCQYLDSLRLS